MMFSEISLKLSCHFRDIIENYHNTFRNIIEIIMTFLEILLKLS